MALDEEKNLWIWGTGNEGQLGLGKSITFQPVPTRLKLDKKKFAYIAAGEFNSFAITTNGEMFIWGANRYGLLGNGSQALGQTAWIPEPFVCKNGLGTFKSVGLSSYYGVGITTNGKAYLWGRNMELNIVLDPVCIQANDELSFASVSAKAQHVMCLTDAGDVYALGFGDYGQLGLEGITSVTTLQRVQALSSATEVVTGSFHSVALTSMASPELVSLVTRTTDRSGRTSPYKRPELKISGNNQRSNIVETMES